MRNVKAHLRIAASFCRVGNKALALNNLYQALFHARRLPDCRLNRIVRAYIVQAIGALDNANA